MQMFLHVLAKLRVKLWRYGPVEAFNIPLQAPALFP